MVLWARVSRVFGRARLVALAVCAVATALVVAAPPGALGQVPDPSPVANPPPATATATESPGVSPTMGIQTPEPIGTGAILPVRGTLTPPPMQDEPLVVPTPTETATLPPTATSLPEITPTPFPTLNLTPVISTEPTPTSNAHTGPTPNVPPLPQDPTGGRVRGKVDPSLLMIASAEQAGTLTPPEREFYGIQPGGLISVEISSDPAQIRATTAAVNALGGSVNDLIETDRSAFLDARVPLTRLADLEHVPSIFSVRRSSRIMTHSAPSYAPVEAPTQALADMNWYAWNIGGDGYTGRNVKVGIVDSGFGAWDAAASVGELPPWPGVACNYGGGSSFHGTSVAEIIYDIAPGSQFVLATIGSDTNIPSAINCLRQQGVHIVSMSLGFGYKRTEGPGNGMGSVNGAISNVADNHGIFVSQSAGNSALGYWRGMARDSNSNLWLEPDYVSYEVITIPGVGPGRGVEVNLRWTDNWSQACRDYDLFIYDDTGASIDRSEEIQACNITLPSYPVEQVQFRNFSGSTRSYSIAIRSKASNGLNHDGIIFEILVRNSFSIVPDFQTRYGSLEHPADNASYGMMSVGAVPSSNPNAIAPYSSRGPNASGARKPDVVAFTDVNTWICENSNACDQSTFPGTSASQPHVAGIAALIKEAYPSQNGNFIRGYIDSAPPTPLGAPIPNDTFGRGRIKLGPLPPVDLAITSFGYPNSVTFGDDVSYDVTVLNAGSATATGVAVTTTLPSQLSYVTSPGCSVSGQVVTCRTVSIQPGQTFFQRIRLAAVSDGMVENRVRVAAAQADYNPANNQREGYSTIRSKADLSVTLTPSAAGGLIVGQGMSYTIAVRNNGPAIARSATVVMSRNSVRVDAAGPNCPSITEAGVTCGFTNIPPGGIVYATVQVTTAHHGTISNTALVTTDALDSNAANNQSTAAQTVVDGLTCPAGSRPNVALDASRQPNQTLRVVVSAGTSSQPSNALEWIEFGSPSNAAVTIVGGPTWQSGPRTQFYVDRAVTHEFSIRRLVAGAVFGVGLIVRDNCGDWQTFVGGGPATFP